MAWFSWRFVEKPFRQRNLISSKNILIFSSSGLLAFICIGLIINFNADSIRKLDNEVYRLNAIRTASIDATNKCHSALSGDDLDLMQPDILGQALARTWVDKRFLEAFYDQPKEILERAGVFLPRSISVEFIKQDKERPKVIVYQNNGQKNIRVLELKLVMVAAT